jgi:homoserine O-acetyltransferase
MSDHRDLWWASPTVELGEVLHIPLSEPFTAAYGGTLPEMQVSYEAWGTLNEARDNAVLIVHPLTADCHVTGEFAGQPRGWWERLVGPGRAIDTDTHFVVCPNLLGGCYGTTGPRFPAPDGEPYLERFPLLTPGDLMRAQRLFVEALGIRRLAMVIGPSLGGMIVWEWAIEAPEMVGRAVVIAAPLRTTPHQIGLNWLQRRGIELDITGNEVVAAVGQMVARGVGMLSYRSPVGLEEKFGREWFKEPGPLLRDRGMFNVESWLRLHGKRITTRFDPFTYILFSRAMDLHDVSRGRGDLVSALNRATCPVRVIGISSDFLYPPAEVHQGADILNHLGRDVGYAEVRSPNGHDAFLIDTDQIEAILRDMAMETAPSMPTPLEREARPVRIGILGAGRVAASFVKLLDERRAQIAARNGLRLDVVAVAEIDREKPLDPAFARTMVTGDPDALVARSDLDVLLDLTRGSGARALVEQALSLGRHVVTPNKVMLRDHGEALDRVAYDHGVRLAYHDCIASGWPLIHALSRPLAQSGVLELHAMLSSACNVMLERMEEGATLADALAEAVARDLTEPDPDLDLSGWDSAQKLTILLARATGRRYGGQHLQTTGIDRIDPRLVRAALDLDLRVKLVAMASRAPDSMTATVRPVAVPRDAHLGLVRGDNNVVVIHTPDGGEMVYLGTGAGDLPVATAVLNDLIGVFDPSHSWTGWYPAAETAVAAPTFGQWLVLRDGRPERTGIPAAEGVPILDVIGRGAGVKRADVPPSRW